MGSLHVDHNFGFGRSLRELDFAGAKSASTEVQRGPLTAARVLHAEIKNYTLNFGFGRPLRGLNLAGAKLVCAEIERDSLSASAVSYG